MFYFVPFKFFKDRKKTPMVDVKGSDIALYGILGLIALIMFFGLIVVPAMMLINQSLPTIQVQPPAF
jgi:hypothetical protein